MMNQLLRTTVPLALLGALLVSVEVATAAQRKRAEGKASSSGAAADQKARSRALPAPESNKDEERAYRALPQPTTVEFLDLPLEDAVIFLKEYHNLPTRFDEPALKAAKISVDAPETMKLNGAPFQRSSISFCIRTTSTGTSKVPV